MLVRITVHNSCYENGTVLSHRNIDQQYTATHTGNDWSEILTKHFVPGEVLCQVYRS